MVKKSIIAVVIVVVAILAGVAVYNRIEYSGLCSEYEGRYRELCFRDYGMNSSNASLCYLIKSNLAWRDSCLAEIAISKLNVSFCTNAGNAEDYCLAKIGILTNNSFLCEVNSSYWSDACFWNVGKNTLNYHLCYKIDNIYDYDDCLSFNALALKRADLCSDVANETKEYSCFVALASNSLNESICSFVDDSFYQGMCYSKLARLKNNSGICEMIRVSYIRNGCYERFKVENEG